MDTNTKIALAQALQPIVSRVRTDVTAVKANGKQAWTNEPLTEARLMRHVNGAGPARGCCPIKEGESVTLVGLLDLDSHKGEIDWPGMAKWAGRITAVAEMFGLQAIPFRSSGGNGIHLIFLWDDPQDAHSVRQALRGVLGAVGLKDGTGGLVVNEAEIFPKQDRVSIGGRGNQFILPLAGLSEPLSPMLDYEPLGKEAAIGMAWPVSEPVPVVVKEAQVVRGSVETVGLETLRSALQAIPNTGAQELDYEAWRNVIFGIHADTDGSSDGLALAHEFSAKSSKYDPDFLDNRVWPYITDKEGGISGRTVLAMAKEYGWQEDISHMFEPLPAVIGGPGGGDVGAGEDESLPAFQRNRNGEILATLENVIRGVTTFAMTGWRVAYDQFKDEIMLTDQRDGSDGWRPLKDVDYVTLRLALEQRDFKPIGREMIRDVVLAVATENQFDSAILWARRLVWDGVPRIDTFLTRYFGGEDTPYVRAVSRYTWSALAGRVLEPGVKADMSPVLIGDQGIRKSSGIAAMAPHQDMFLEIDLGDDDDKNARKLRGVLIAETGEMKGFYSREQEHIKAFMSRRFEVWVPKYMERATRYHRRCVFIGSSNQSEFLVDETGNRRWLPVKVTRVDTDAIEADREQLWAEAVALFDAQGVVWQDAEELARGVHKDHMVHDEWEHIIDAWLAGEDDGVPRSSRALRLAEIVSGALGIFVANIDRKTEIRVGKVMRKLGYEKRQTWSGSKNFKLWHKS